MKGKQKGLGETGEKEMTPLTDCKRQRFATRWQKIQLPLKFTAYPNNHATKYHTFRVHCQVQEWIGNWVDPEKLVWCLRKGQLEPKTRIRQWLLIHY